MRPRKTGGLRDLVATQVKVVPARQVDTRPGGSLRGVRPSPVLVLHVDPSRQAGASPGRGSRASQGVSQALAPAVPRVPDQGVSQVLAPVRNHLPGEREQLVRSRVMERVIGHPEVNSLETMGLFAPGYVPGRAPTAVTHPDLTLHEGIPYSSTSTHEERTI